MCYLVSSHHRPIQCPAETSPDRKNRVYRINVRVVMIKRWGTHSVRFLPTENFPDKMILSFHA